MENFISWLKSKPKWFRVLICILFAAAVVAASFLPVSCSVVRTTLDGSGRVTTTVNQSALDSTRVDVQLFKTN